MKDAASTVVPVFRKQFETSKEIRSAGLEVTCDGVYEAVLNGKRVGEFILAPGWTEYRKRLQVQTYDIAPLLCGSNTLDITVGNGWFRRTNAPWTKTPPPMNSFRQCSSLSSTLYTKTARKLSFRLTGAGRFLKAQSP